MKRIFFAPIFLAVAVFSFNCSGMSERSNTGVAGSGTPQESGVKTLETELVNEEPSTTYGNLFNRVENTQKYDALSLAGMEDDLNSFVKLIGEAGLEPLIRKEGPITVFMPTNEAIESLLTRDDLNLNDPDENERLVKIIKTHIIPAEVSAKHFTNTKLIETSSGEYIAVDVDENGSMVKIGEADIIRADVQVSNGLIHVVDDILETREPSDTAIE